MSERADLRAEVIAAAETLRRASRDSADSASIAAEAAEDAARHWVTRIWDVHGGEVVEYRCLCGEIWTRDEEICPESDAAI